MMLNAQMVNQWLARYIEAWKTYAPAKIAALFSVDCVHRYTPFDTPQIGREAIVESWLAHRDPPDTYDADYTTLMIDGDRAVTTGRTYYYHAGTRDLSAEFANVWVLRFNATGECCEFLEWYMERDTEG